MKVASLTEFRDMQIERELLKTASLQEELLYHEMKKVAEYGTEEEILWMIQYYEPMEKESGVYAKGLDLLSRALGRAGSAAGSARLTAASGRAADAAAKRYSSAAVNPQGMRQFMQADEYGRLAGEAGKRGGQQAQAAKAIRETKDLRRQVRTGNYKDPTPAAPSNVRVGPDSPTARRAAAKSAPAPAATPAAKPAPTPAAAAPAAAPAASRPVARVNPSKPRQAPDESWLSNRALGMGVVGTGAAVGTGALGYGAYKAKLRGDQENRIQQQRGFNYGLQ